MCACFYNEKGEWTGVFDKKNITVVPTPEIVIINPEEGEKITWSPEGYLAKGTYSGLENGFNIYLIVHSLVTGQWGVQSTHVVFSDGTWEAKVFFGTEELGAGDYELYAIITDEVLSEGLLEKLPAYVAKSEVKVSRVESTPLISWSYLYVGVIALIFILLPLIAYRKRQKETKAVRGNRKKALKEVKIPEPEEVREKLNSPENEIKQHVATISEPEDMEVGCTPVSIQLVKKQYLKLSVFSPPFPFPSLFPSRSLWESGALWQNAASFCCIRHL